MFNNIGFFNFYFSSALQSDSNDSTILMPIVCTGSVNFVAGPS